MEATALGAYAFYQMFAELEALIADGSLTPDVDTLTQVRDAVRAMIAVAVARYSRSERRSPFSRATTSTFRATRRPTRRRLRPACGRCANALINGAPGALDTVNELAAALGDDANFATTITNMLALKAALASPVFTGNPRAPKPPDADNDTSVGDDRVREAIGGTPGSTWLMVPVHTRGFRLLRQPRLYVSGDGGGNGRGGFGGDEGADGMNGEVLTITIGELAYEAEGGAGGAKSGVLGADVLRRRRRQIATTIQRHRWITGIARRGRQRDRPRRRRTLLLVILAALATILRRPQQPRRRGGRRARCIWRCSTSPS